MMKYVDILNRGGIFMWPILFCSILALTIACERTYYLFFKLALNLKEFSRRVFHAVESGDVNRGMRHCQQYADHPMAAVLNAALVKANRGDKEIQRAMEGAYLEVAPAVQSRISYLSALANISTLLGLLGTIQGLIQAFKGVSVADAAVKQEVLASGIAIAMYTTFAGLVVAIPALIAFHLLSNRQNDILDSTQEAGTRLLNIISASNRDLRAGPKEIEPRQRNAR